MHQINGNNNHKWITWWVRVWRYNKVIYLLCHHQYWIGCFQHVIVISLPFFSSFIFVVVVVLILLSCRWILTQTFQVSWEGTKYFCLGIYTLRVYNNTFERVATCYIHSSHYSCRRKEKKRNPACLYDFQNKHDKQRRKLWKWLKHILFCLLFSFSN